MNKKSLFLFLVLAISICVILILFYRFAQWNEQDLGTIFTYEIMIIFILFILAPFRYMKDSKANIGIISYIKYMSITLLHIGKFIVNVLKQTLLTLTYVVKKSFSKDLSKNIDQK